MVLRSGINSIHFLNSFLMIILITLILRLTYYFKIIIFQIFSLIIPLCFIKLLAKIFFNKFKLIYFFQNNEEKYQCYLNRLQNL